MYWVYIIRNEKGIYYKGSTSDINNRLIDHNNDKSRYTSGRGPWELVYFKQYETKTEALIEERRLKKLNVLSLERLLNNNSVV
jgi:putative endonuclease